MKVYFEHLQEYGPALQRGFSFLDNIKIDRNTRVAIKPNLTFPTFRKGVMTSPEAIEQVVIYLKNFTDHIAIVESDSGGYNRFSMDEVYSRTGIADLAQRYGIRVLNLSNMPPKTIRFRFRLRERSVPLPRLLLEETDLFISMPVPKVHANAIVSLALKNQWGIIQEPALRLKLHPYFKEVIYRVNKALPTSIVIVDGRYGLTENGPMRGKDIDLGWFLMSDNLFANDLVLSRMMGFQLSQIPYLAYILKKEKLRDTSGIVFNSESYPVENRFYLKRTLTDYPGLFTFNSRVLAYIGYESTLAKPLHWLLYRVRDPFY